MNNARIVMTTYPDEWRKLKHLITWILKQNLAACVQRINYMKSYYIWKGDLKKTEEKLLLIKTTSDKQDKLIDFLKKNHPYEIPEIIVIHPDEVDSSYLSRLSEEKAIEKKGKQDEKKDLKKEKKEQKEE